MAREFSRTDRVGQQIHKEVASILQQEIKHQAPELGMITVSGVEVTRDLAHAKVFVTFYESDKEKVKSDMALLDESKGFVRSLLAKRVRMRSIPAIRFVQDTSLTEGIRISNLVSDVIRDDESKSADRPDEDE